MNDMFADVVWFRLRMRKNVWLSKISETLSFHSRCTYMVAALDQVSKLSSSRSRRAYLSKLHQKVHQLLPCRALIFILLFVL